MRLHLQTDGGCNRDKGEDEKQNRVHVSLGSEQGHQQARDKKIDQRNREQKHPGEAHELVVAEARQRPANPDKDKEQREYLAAEPKERNQNRLQEWNQKQSSQS